jgi:hypothetical protein
MHDPDTCFMCREIGFELCDALRGVHVIYTAKFGEVYDGDIKYMFNEQGWSVNVMRGGYVKAQVPAAFLKAFEE